jgi:hypothetical protein
MVVSRRRLKVPPLVRWTFAAAELRGLGPLTFLVAKVAPDRELRALWTTFGAHMEHT